MADGAGVIIRRKFARPSAAEVAEVTGLPSGWIADANGQRGAIDHRLRPYTSVKPFAGVALTVSSAPNDNLLAYTAVSVAQPGDVLFLGTEEFDKAAVVGDIFGGFAKNQGVAAVVTDGLIRDVEGFEKLGLPVYARGVSPNSPLKNGPGEIGTAITLGGVRIESGDLVVGDSDGVVVVARKDIARMFEGLKTVREKETGADKRIAAGETEPAWLQETLERVGVRQLD
jgi:4-hydroxy-4-methyl-2-oxoglutarate aldolase